MDPQRRQSDLTIAVARPAASDAGRVIETSIPFRLDALHWSRFHTRVAVALGITWILDGLEVTLAGALSPALKESPRLHFSNFDVGLANSAYLAGAVIGSAFLFLLMLAVLLIRPRGLLGAGVRV